MIGSHRRLDCVQRGMAEGMDDVMPARYPVDSRCCLLPSLGPVIRPMKCVCLANGATESQQDFLAIARH